MTGNAGKDNILMPQIPQISGPVTGGKTLTSGNNNTPQNATPFSIDGVSPVQRPAGVVQKGDAGGAGSRGVADQSALPPGLQGAKDPSMAVETLHEVFSGELLENAKLNGYTELVGEIDDLTKAIYINPDKLMNEILTQEKDNTVFAGNQLFEILRDLCAESGEDTKDLIANLLKSLNFAMSRGEILSAVKSNIRFLAEYFGQNTTLSKSLYQLYNKWDSGDPAKNFEELKNETAALMRTISGSLQNDSRTETLVPLVTHNLSRYNTNEYMMKEAFTQLMSQVPKASMREGLSKAFTQFVTKLLTENTNSYNNNTTNSAENQVLRENFDVSAEKTAVLVYLSKLLDGLEKRITGDSRGISRPENFVMPDEYENLSAAAPRENVREAANEGQWIVNDEDFTEMLQEGDEPASALRGGENTPEAMRDGESLRGAFGEGENMAGVPRESESINGALRNGDELNGAPRNGEDSGNALRNGEEVNGAPRNGGELDGMPRNNGELDGMPRNNGELGGMPRNDNEPNAMPRNGEELNGTLRNGEEVNGGLRNSQDLNDALRSGEDLNGVLREGESLNGTMGRGEELTGALRNSRDFNGALRSGEDIDDAFLEDEEFEPALRGEHNVRERGTAQTDRRAAPMPDEQKNTKIEAAYKNTVPLRESRINLVVRNFDSGVISGRDAIGRLLSLLIPRMDTDAADVMQTVVKNTDSLTEMVNFLNHVLENIPDIPERQILCDAFETIINRMAQEHEMPAEKSNGNYESETVKALTSFIERNVNHPAIRGIDNFNASNLLQSILNAPGVFTPLAHYIIPLQVEDTRAFGELWVDNDNTSKKSADGEKKYHLFLTFDVEAVGRFEVDAYSAGKELNLSVLYPKSYRYRVPALTDKITKIAAGVGFNVQNFKTGILIKPHTLAETFPRITENRRTFDVKA